MRKLLYRRILQDMVLLYTAQQDVVSLIIVPLNKEKYALYDECGRNKNAPSRCGRFGVFGVAL